MIRLAFNERSTVAILMLMIAMVAGCQTSTPGIEVNVRDDFLTYDRIALVSTLNRETEDFFIPLYMNAFPSQTLVERRDVNAVIGEQDLLPERLNEETRAKLRRILGVKAIVYPRSFKEGFAIKVIQTETGAIAASAYVDATNPIFGGASVNTLVRKAIDAMHLKAYQHGGPSAADETPTTTIAPAPMQPVRPPPHD